MKLLIITQKVDKNDSVLGFFCRWITEFSKHFETITVICLYKGEYDLPENVKVLSLGKEERQSRLQYLIHFYWYVCYERKNYDAIFVHMNQIYIVLAGILWKIWRKKLVIWYTHKSVTLKLRLSVLFANLVFTASKESFRIRTSKVRIMGHGIDVDFFSPDSNVRSGEALLSAGRLMPVKHHDLAIEAANEAGMLIRIAGEGTEQKKLELLAKKLGAHAEFLGPLNQTELRNEYRRASFLIHTSETGSLDKAVLEALACGLPVISTSNSLEGIPIIKATPSPKSIAEAIALHRDKDSSSLPEYVRKHHSLENLISNIVEKIKSI